MDQHYHWLHVPSGQRGTTPFYAVKDIGFRHPSELEVLRLVNKWNAAQPGVWVYWI